MATLSAKLRGSSSELTPVWRDGVVLDDEVRRRALPLIVVGAQVRVTPESDRYPAGWQTLAQAVATLYAVYGVPLELACDDAAALDELYARGELEAELGMPEVR